MLRLESNGETAFFVGDVVHHPVQIFRPELHLPGCDDLAAAIQTRRTFFERASVSGAAVFPAHFAEPHHGRIGLDHEEEFAFVISDDDARDE